MSISLPPRSLSVTSGSGSPWRSSLARPSSGNPMTSRLSASRASSTSPPGLAAATTKVTTSSAATASEPASSRGRAIFTPPRVVTRCVLPLNTQRNDSLQNLALHFVCHRTVRAQDVVGDPSPTTELSGAHPQQRAASGVSVRSSVAAWEIAHETTGTTETPESGMAMEMGDGVRRR